MTDLMTPGDDFAAIADDDNFLDTLATDVGIDTDDPTRALLVGWRDELSAAAATTAAPATAPWTADMQTSDESAAGNRHWYRSRGAAGAAALFVVLAASTGVAAAMPGSPVHRALFGTPPTTSDLYGARITALLDEVAAGIDAANTAGGITDGRRAILGGKLAAATALLAQEQSPNPTLATKLASLRAALAALPTLRATAPDATGAGGDSDGHPAGTHSDQETGSDDGQETDDGSSSSTSGEDSTDGDTTDGDGTRDRSGEDGTDGSDDSGMSDSGSSGEVSDDDGSFGDGGDAGDSGSDSSDSSDVAGTTTSPVSGDGDGGDSPTTDD